MTKQDFFDGKIGCRCDTKEEYDQLMRECEVKGMAWRLGFKPTEWCPGVMPNTIYAHDKRLTFNGSYDKSGVPFSALFLDPWAEFVTGKWMRVKPEHWSECARRLEAEGIKWINSQNAMEKVPVADSIDGNYYIGTWHGKKQPTFICDSGWMRHNKGADVIDFSAIARPEPEPVHEPQPYDGRGKHKVGDLFEVVIPGFVFGVGDIIKLYDDDGSSCPQFERLSDGHKACKFWDRLKPYTPPPVHPRIEITTDGKTTTATLYENGNLIRSAASDEHNASLAALQALARLLPGTCALMTPGQADTAINLIRSATNSLLRALI